MIVLNLRRNDDLDFVRELQELRDILKKKSITIGLVESFEGDTHSIKVICDEKCYNEKVKNTLYLYISNILYNIVLEQYRKKEMFEFLVENYFFLKQDEILEVEKIIMSVLKGEATVNDDRMIYCINKVNSIIEKIKECLEENTEINIQGFITFRMKELRSGIEDIIEKVIEGYMVEKEYKEFVKLLKYFVDIQESRIEEVNIYIQDGGGYIIKDKCGKDIFEEFIKELSECKVDTEANIEDIIISGLITNAPKNVIIHGKEKCNNKEFLNTIINVFGERAYYCKGCSECKIVKTQI